MHLSVVAIAVGGPTATLPAMNYHDENSKCIGADCPKCGKSFEKRLEWIARHQKQQTWGCLRCKHRSKVYVKLPGAAPDKPLSTMAEALYKAQHDRRLESIPK